MTIEQLLKFPVEWENKDCYLESHMPETNLGFYADKPNERVTVKYYKSFSFDGERSWSLGSVWLDDTPFMIIQNAGRGGQDHEDRFIFDKGVYEQAVLYLLSLKEDTFEHVFSLNEDIPQLTHFYNCDLEQPEHFKPYDYSKYFKKAEG